PHLPQVAHALRADRLLAGAAQSRQQDGDQHRDDTDDDEQFDKGKTTRRMFAHDDLTGSGARRLTKSIASYHAAGLIKPQRGRTCPGPHFWPVLPFHGSPGLTASACPSPINSFFQPFRLPVELPCM